MRGAGFITSQFEKRSGASAVEARRIVGEYFEELFDGQTQKESEAKGSPRSLAEFVQGRKEVGVGSS